MHFARSAALAAVLGLGLLAAPQAVDAWGNTGHRLIGVAAVRSLPDSLPAFVRSASAAADIGELAREPDRWKGAGQPHDRERDTAHFVDLTDDGQVMTAAGPTLDQLPRLKSEYDALLARAGIDVDDAGYLPYAILDAQQQLKQDFAYWRILAAAEARETDPGRRAWYRADRERREALTLRDIGMLAHYVGDGAQPHHVTVHYNGWGDYPNPEGFSNSRQTHSIFEGAATSRAARLDAVEAAMPAPNAASDLRPRVSAYLKTTLTQVVPVYRLDKAGAFRGSGTPEGAAFINARLGAGAAELRDLIVMAWQASGEGSIGWPAVKVAEVEAGTVDPWLSLVGED